MLYDWAGDVDCVISVAGFVFDVVGCAADGVG